MNHLIIGEQRYFIDVEINKIVSKIPIEQKELNYTVYDCIQVPLATIIEDACTIPFFSENKIIILKNPYFLTSSQPKVSFEQDVEVLLKYLENPNSSTTMIFHARYEKLDERKKIVKYIKKNCAVHQTKQLNEQTIDQIVSDLAKERGIQFESGALFAFSSRVAMNLDVIQNELDKLSLYKKSISIVDVNQVVTRRIEDNIFILVEAIIINDKSAALSYLNDLLMNNEEPIKIIILISNQIRLLYQVKYYQRIGYAQKDIASVLSIHPYRVKLALQQCHRFDEVQLLNSLEELADLDYQIKQGLIDKKIGLEMFIIRR